MILLIDSSTPTCRLTLINGQEKFEDIWQADRSLARDLLARISDFLQSHDANWSSLTGLGAFLGPGSFTGLRIGLTVFNTIADAEKIPIMGGTGDNWQADIVSKLNKGEDAKILLPLYGADAHITKPKK